jgi:3-oxoacyl-[acyl-carrier protein] reductase
MDLDLAGKVVFITGASGGLGADLVRAFVAEGAMVAAHSSRGVLGGPPVMSLLGDVRDAAGLHASMRKASERWGRVDVCVVNAGVWPHEALPLHELPEARVREVIETNLLGAMWTAGAVMAELARTGPRKDGHGASLMFIGSTAGRFGERGHAEYAVSKAGLRGLMLSIKNEIVALDPKARVNLIEPGWTVTPMAAATIEREGLLGSITRTMPLRQVAAPEDISRAALFLASPTSARHITGEALTIAGGMEGRVLWG